MIESNNFDVAMLQEIWYRDDHKFLSSAFPHYTTFNDFNTGCSKVKWCSGLVILSKHVFEETPKFEQFSVSRNLNVNAMELQMPWDNIYHDGNGVGQARIHWTLSDGSHVKVDLFTTQLTGNWNRFDYSMTQAIETLQLIEKSNADIKILAGNTYILIHY